MNVKSTVYWCVRGYTQLLAIVSLLALTFASISPANIEAPSPLNAPLSFLPLLLLSVLLLMPYRWNVHGWYYQLRLGLYMVGSIWLAYLSITSALTFRVGFGDLLISLAMGLLAISAPVSLLLHQKLHQTQNDGN